MKIKTIVFDFDGTLVDSLEDVVASLRQAFEKSGIPIKKFDIEKMMQQQLRETICMLAPGITDTQTDIVIENFRAIYDTIDYPNTSLMPGATELLTDLEKRMIDMYIVSNKRHIPTIRILDKFNLSRFFAGIFNPDMYGDERRMTKSELLAHVLELRSLQKNAIAYVGDSEVDVLAAKENRVRSIAMTNGYGRTDGFRIQPDHRIRHLSEILALI